MSDVYPTPSVWKCLIRWEWLPGVLVPHCTDGKIRCARVELMEEIKLKDWLKRGKEVEK